MNQGVQNEQYAKHEKPFKGNFLYISDDKCNGQRVVLNAQKWDNHTQRNALPTLNNPDKHATEWLTISVDGCVKFQIPSTMEVQGGVYKDLTQALRSKVLNIPYDSQRGL